MQFLSDTGGTDMRDELGAKIKKLFSIQKEADQESITDELLNPAYS
jgi:hypothetical protein